MKVFSVTGLSTSGKTTTIEKMIGELKNRGYSVGTVKEIHFEAFRLDTEGKNTYRHRIAGANTVTARAASETDIMYQGHLPIYDVLKHYTEDYVILEGVKDAVVPNISVSAEDSVPDITPLTFALSGRFANNHSGVYNGLPVINALIDTQKLVDLIEEKVPDLMYDIDVECCGICGYDCRGLLSKHLKGEESLSKCVLKNESVSLKINGNEVIIVPFVQKLLKNVVLGVVSELKGYEKDAEIVIKLK